MSGIRITRLVEINVGYSAHGQKAVLLGGEDGSGNWSWALKLEARSFREQPIIVEGLTAESIRQMAAAVERDGR